MEGERGGGVQGDKPEPLSSIRGIDRGNYDRKLREGELNVGFQEGDELWFRQ